MSVYSVYTLCCTQCGTQYIERDESVRFLRQLAKKDGWSYRKVKNGSYWDFCPKCTKIEDEE